MKVLFVSSAGGHFSELKKLKMTMKSFESIIVTEKTDFMDGEVHYFIKYSSRHNLFKYFFYTVLNIFKIFKILKKEKPQIIVSTGAHTAFYFFLIGKLYHTKNIYIESFARVTEKSLTWKISGKVIDKVIVQHPELKEKYPEVEYFGGVY